MPRIDTSKTNLSAAHVVISNSRKSTRSEFVPLLPRSPLQTPDSWLRRVLG